MTERDTRVTEAYRDAAREKAPEHLDRAIIDKAKRAARPPYARSRAWTRPLAWAATIVLSAAIVLELTQVEEPAGTQYDFATPVTEEADAAANEAPVATGADEREMERQAAPAEALEEALPSTPAPAPGRAEPAKTEAVQKSRKRQSQDAPARISADDFELQDKDLLQSAEKAAELRHGEPKSGAAAFLAVDATPACPDDAMQDPESWLACIEQLEETGMFDEAERQRLLLAETFPDFELP